MRLSIRIPLFIFGACVAVLRPAVADEVEVISLRYRLAEQVLPMLRPLVSPGAAVSGMQGTLVVRGSRRDIDVVKQTLASIDRMPRRLIISVRQDAGADVAAGGVALGGTLGTEGSRAGVRVYSSRAASDERVSQTVQVLEGNAALIMVGQSVPVREQVIQAPLYPPVYPVRPGTPPGAGPGFPGGGGVGERITYREIATGFSVVPRLAGDRVTLDISPQSQGVSTDPGMSGVGGQTIPIFNTQVVSTSVSGRLGEWIELAGMVQDDRRGERGFLTSRQAARQDNRRVWVKVEELP